MQGRRCPRLEWITPPPGCVLQRDGPAFGRSGAYDSDAKFGYCFGIRSERRLCEEVYLNLAYRWFCGLWLEGTVPNHSTFSRNRHGRFRQSETFRFLFEECYVAVWPRAWFELKVLPGMRASSRRMSGQLVVRYKQLAQLYHVATCCQCQSTHISQVLIVEP